MCKFRQWLKKELEKEIYDFRIKKINTNKLNYHMIYFKNFRAETTGNYMYVFPNRKAYRNFIFKMKIPEHIKKRVENEETN